MGMLYLLPLLTPAARCKSSMFVHAGTSAPEDPVSSASVTPKSTPSHARDSPAVSPPAAASTPANSARAATAASPPAPPLAEPDFRWQQLLEEPGVAPATFNRGGSSDSYLGTPLAKAAADYFAKNGSGRRRRPAAGPAASPTPLQSPPPASTPRAAPLAPALSASSSSAASQHRTSLSNAPPTSQAAPEAAPPPPVLAPGAEDLFWVAQLHQALSSAGYAALAPTTNLLVLVPAPLLLCAGLLCAQFCGLRFPSAHR